MNFSEEQFKQAQQNMNADNMRNAHDKINGMTDEQLRSMAQMTGQNIDPQMMRQAAQMFQGMSPEQMQNMQNMAKNMNYNEFQDKQKQASQQQQQYQNTQPKPQQQQQTQSSQPTQYHTEFDKIDKFKQKGNEHFKKGDYGEASSQYMEAIFEIEEIRMKAIYNSYSQQKKQDLQKLEIACRMNYANVKAKEEDYELVKFQATEVLKIDSENAKGNFRMGQALLKLSEFSEALPYLQKANKLLPNDQTVQTMLKEAKSQSGDKQQEEQKQEEPQQEQEQKQEKEEVKQEKEKEQEVKQEKDEVVIEEEKQTQQNINTSTSSNSFNEQPVGPNNNYGQMPQPNAAQANMAKEQLKNMSDDQLNFMAQQMKNMDRETLRAQMKAQTGMDMTDEQLDMYKNMMTPETLKMMKNMDLPNPQQQQQQQSGSQQQQPSFDPSKMDSSQAFEQLKNNPDMVKMAMEQMKANPEMMKNMAKMMGPNNPMSSYLEKSSPEDIEKMMNMITKFQPLITGGMKVFGFIKKNKYPVIALLVVFVAYFFF